SIGSAVVASPTRPPDEVAANGSLAQRLSVSTWALAVPIAWLAAPLAEVRSGDSVDLLAIRSGDRPLTITVAADLRVMGADERAGATSGRRPGRRTDRAGERARCSEPLGREVVRARGARSLDRLDSASGEARVDAVHPRHVGSRRSWQVSSRRESRTPARVA